MTASPSRQDHGHLGGSGGSDLVIAEQEGAKDSITSWESVNRPSTSDRAADLEEDPVERCDDAINVGLAKSRMGWKV